MPVRIRVDDGSDPASKNDVAENCPGHLGIECAVDHLVRRSAAAHLQRAGSAYAYSARDKVEFEHRFETAPGHQAFNAPSQMPAI